MFHQEESVLQRAEGFLEQGLADEATQAAMQDLATGYRKLMRQMRRMITMGDRMQEELQRCARTDGLTGISNRRHFMEQAQREIARSQRTGAPFSLCLLDADHFKRINDTYGHDTGDKALTTLAAILQEQCREMDMVARFGGEEFVILFPDTSCCDAQKIAERIRLAIAETRITHNDYTLTVTVSMGITGTAHLDDTDATCQSALTLDQILQYADIALYAAKKNGRNCVESYSGSSCSRKICP